MRSPSGKGCISSIFLKSQSIVVLMMWVNCLLHLLDILKGYKLSCLARLESNFGLHYQPHLVLLTNKVNKWSLLGNRKYQLFIEGFLDRSWWKWQKAKLVLGCNFCCSLQICLTQCYSLFFSSQLDPPAVLAESWAKSGGWYYDKLRPSSGLEYNGWWCATLWG